MSFSLRSVAILCVVALVVFGCRSYGDHGSQEAMYNQMQTALDQFESELERAQADLSLLIGAAEEEDVLDSFEDAYRDIISEHERLLERHQDLTQGLDGTSPHRELRRAYGTLITEQDMVRTRYHRHHMRIQFALDIAEEETPELALDRSRYFVVPSFYDRADRPEPPTMREALADAGE